VRYVLTVFEGLLADLLLITQNPCLFCCCVVTLPVRFAAVLPQRLFISSYSEFAAVSPHRLFVLPLYCHNASEYFAAVLPHSLFVCCCVATKFVFAAVLPHSLFILHCVATQPVRFAAALPQRLFIGSYQNTFRCCVATQPVHFATVLPHSLFVFPLYCHNASEYFAAVSPHSLFVCCCVATTPLNVLLLC